MLLGVAAVALITTIHGRKYYGLINYGCIYSTDSMPEFMIALL